MCKACCMIKLITTLLLCFFATTLLGQNIYKGLPVLKAKTGSASYRINEEWVNDSWSVAPEIEYDSLLVGCHDKYLDFGFYTDSDSIVFKLKSGESRSFYVLLNDSVYARTVIKAIKPDYKALVFDTVSRNASFSILYEQNNDNEYLGRLRSLYPIDSLVRNKKTDMQKALVLLSWVHNQWQHNGDNQPKKYDAISILEEVKEGKNFRCVEYGIVLSACLNAIGLKARTLALKTKDVAITQYGAGHVLTEVYLNDLKKWVLVDGQWDAMPVLDDVPLNAVEFQRAIATDYKNLKIMSHSGTSKNNYTSWIYPYLYFFDVSFDNRQNKKGGQKTVEGKSSLMLVPLFAENPTIFQIDDTIDYCVYTNAVNEFYAAPQ